MRTRPQLLSFPPPPPAKTPRWKPLKRAQGSKEIALARAPEKDHSPTHEKTMLEHFILGLKFAFSIEKFNPSGPKKPWQPQMWQDLTRFSPLDFSLLFPDFMGLVLLSCTWILEKKQKISSGEPPVETAPRNCRFLSLVVVELVLNPGPCFLQTKRGQIGQKNILDWKFHSVLPAWFFQSDASFLLTVEVFLLTVRLFTYGGGTVSKKDQTQFPDRGNRKQERPNLISGRGVTVSKKDQTNFQP